MGFSDEDFNKAAKVNSRSQLYRQSGNSIVCQVLMAIFLQLGIQGKPRWNDMSVEERQFGGFGIFMVKQTMDDVSYVREDDTNTLTFSKKWKQD